MSARAHIQAQEQFLHLENYRSLREQPKELDLFKEQEKAEILDILEAKEWNMNKYPSEIEPLNFDEM